MSCDLMKDYNLHYNSKGAHVVLLSDPISFHEPISFSVENEISVIYAMLSPIMYN